jgi:hypothetical protein
LRYYKLNFLRKFLLTLMRVAPRLRETYRSRAAWNGGKLDKMKRLLIIMIAAVALAAVAGATPCGTGLVAVVGGAASQSPCTNGVNGVLSFSNWTLLDNDGSTNAYNMTIIGPPQLNNPPGDSRTNPLPYSIQFSTNMDNFSTPASGFKDVLFQFVVTGPLNFASLSVATSAISNIDETICSIAFNSSHQCTGTVLYESGLIQGPGGTASGAVTANTTTPGIYYVQKDIRSVSGAGTSQGFTEGFGAVPEPMTFSLIGAGLVGLVVLGRRMKKA